MKLGRAKVKITPNRKIQLAGFSHRMGKTSTVNSDIYLKSFFLINKDTKILILVADLIWWDDALVLKLKKEIKNIYHLEENNIFFHATHNHSGPQTSNKFSEKLGKIDEDYISMLSMKVIESVDIALENIKTTNVSIYRGSSQIGVNRRKQIDNKIIMAPHEQGENDNRLTTIVFKDDLDEVISIWINYGCHPTTTDENSVSSEFIGVCTELLEGKFENSIVAYLQGYCGDIRPNHTYDNHFVRGDFNTTQKFGYELFEEVLQSMTNDIEECYQEEISVKTNSVELSFSTLDIHGDVPINMKEEWPKLVNNNEGKYVLEIKLLSLFSNLKFLTCNGEIVTHYSNFIKDIDSDVIPLGYTNGMVGYIPTSDQLQLGGYESKESIFYFGYPNILEEQIEKRIKKVTKKMLEEVKFNG